MLGYYGKEINGTMPSIARMDIMMHGAEDFRIADRNARLSDPADIEWDWLMAFDGVVANPPYLIKTWNRDAYRNDL